MKIKMTNYTTRFNNDEEGSISQFEVSLQITDPTGVEQDSSTGYVILKETEGVELDDMTKRDIQAAAIARYKEIVANAI